MNKCGYRLINELEGGDGRLKDPSNDFTHSLLFFKRAHHNNEQPLIYKKEQCVKKYEDIERYAAKIKNELFDMNVNLVKSFDKYNDTHSINYLEASNELLKQLNGINDDVYNFNLKKYCKKIKMDENKKKINLIAHEINIRRYIQVYINKQYNTNISRGFLKMHDILSRFNLIDMTKKQVNTFHSCEAPGNFINATNHWIKLHEGVLPTLLEVSPDSGRNSESKIQNFLPHDPKFTYNWIGNSLNPFNPDVKSKFGNVFSDDYGYLGRHRERWDFGKDDTGDITNIDNLLFWESRYNYSIDLMTSDCGYIELYEDYDSDKMLSLLNYCQMILGLLLLKIGGNIVGKIFLPIDSPLLISIIFIYNLYFADVHIIKQESGNLFSSEVYIVGISKLKHLDEITKKNLLDVIKDFDTKKTLFDIFPSKFIEDLRSTSKKLMSVIEDNIDMLLFYYENDEIFKKHQRRYFMIAKKKCAKKWINNNSFKVIDKLFLL